MTVRNVVLIIMLIGLTILSVGCGESEVQSNAAESLTVESVVETQTEKVETGPVCEYLFISTDIQHRLGHYRICNSEGNEEKRLNALQAALDDCFELCDTTFPDESGSKTQTNLDCVAQCKEE